MKILDQLRLKSKAEQSMAKAHIYFFEGGTLHRNSANWEVGTPHIPFKWGEQLGLGKNIYWDEGGTPHILF